MVTSQIHFHCATRGIPPQFFLKEDKEIGMKTKACSGWNFERGHSCSLDGGPKAAASPSWPCWLETYVLQQLIAFWPQVHSSQSLVFHTEFSGCETPLRSWHSKIIHVASSVGSQSHATRTNLEGQWGQPLPSAPLPERENLNNFKGV